MEEEGLEQLLGFEAQVKMYSRILYTQEQMESKVQKIEKQIKNLNPQSSILVTQVYDNKFQISMPLEQHASLCIFQFEMKIDFLMNKVSVMGYFNNSMDRESIKKKLLRLQVCRYMLRLNSNMRVGAFYINPIHGHIGFNMQCMEEKQPLLFQTEIDEIAFTKYLESLMLTAVQSFRFHFIRILLLVNKLKIHDLPIYSEYMEQRHSRDQNWRKLPNGAEDLLKRIKQVVSNKMHEPFSQTDYEQYGPILSKQINSESKVLIEIRPVSDLFVDKQQKISEGGFCEIFSKDVHYSINNGPQQKRPLAIKQAREETVQNQNRIKRELNILQKLSIPLKIEEKLKDDPSKKYLKTTGCCPYIAQFYTITERPEILLMERYYHQSLDYLKVKQAEVLSLSTRLFMAHSVAMGLRYCHAYGIVHMDIKPGNILIAKNLMAKITDFGETQEIFDPITGRLFDQKGFDSGKTFPYCAPEIQNQNTIITTAYDIYCFGVLLFELIFDRFPIDYRKANPKVLEEKLSKQNYFVRYNEEYDKTLGPQVITKYLGRMCLQCLQPDPKLRPNIDKIVLVLKDCLTYLDKVY